MVDLLDCDILNVLQCKKTEDVILPGIMTSCFEFRAQALITTNGYLAYKTECTNKNESNAEIISQIYSQVKDMELKLDKALLEQKVVVKKISNVIEQQEKFNNVIDQARLRKESSSLELVDLRSESEEKKREKQLRWDAIKRACHAYKDTLQFHISIVETEEDDELIEISFFPQFASEAEYYAKVLQFEDYWKVKHIHPSLKSEHKKKLKDVIDFSKEKEVLNVTAFLCKMRHIFLRYYLNTK